MQKSGDSINHEWFDFSLKTDKRLSKPVNVLNQHRLLNHAEYLVLRYDRIFFSPNRPSNTDTGEHFDSFSDGKKIESWQLAEGIIRQVMSSGPRYNFGVMEFIRIKLARVSEIWRGSIPAAELRGSTGYLLKWKCSTSSRSNILT